MTFEPEGEPIETGGPEDRLLPWDRVRDVTGLSRSTAWRLQQVGDFPEPVRISPNRVGWWESELTAWKATRTVRGLPHPKPLARPREPKLIQTTRSP
ncbi:helix-turn-helix transcriptional regulator, partial [Mycolicibacterium poriferae]|uniref:helix-turn-helix transcriptional regulator n=2 Tax=Bacteria TaxID=2 RepID=UPI0024B99B74